jgi:RIO kinase 1
MSGKEAQIYVVVSEGETRVAKIYKESERRNFKNRADYTEGRKVRNSRDARAMAKRSRHGKAQDEAAWRSTEVDMIYRLRQVGVRVPIPYHFIDGVLIMEMVTDGEGMPAPRLGEMQFTKAQAHDLFTKLLGEVQRMLCAGVVHGDLSDFNVLMAADGPVVIDFPQSVHAANNRNARKLLLRDVANLDRFVERFDTAWRPKTYAEELWSLYENGNLTATTVLTGRYVAPSHAAATDEVFALIEDAREDAERRLGVQTPARRPQPPRAPRRPQGQGKAADASAPQRRPESNRPGQGQPNRPGGSRRGRAPVVSYTPDSQSQSSGGREGGTRPFASTPAPRVEGAPGKSRPGAPYQNSGGTQAGPGPAGPSRRNSRGRRPPRRS